MTQKQRHKVFSVLFIQKSASSKLLVQVPHSTTAAESCWSGALPWAFTSQKLSPERVTCYGHGQNLNSGLCDCKCSLLSNPHAYLSLGLSPQPDLGFTFQLDFITVVAEGVILPGLCSDSPSVWMLSLPSALFARSSKVSWNAAPSGKFSRLPLKGADSSFLPEYVEVSPGSC